MNIYLQKWLQELGLPYELWHLDEGTVDLTTAPPEGIFYNRMSASSLTAIHQNLQERLECMTIKY